MEKEKIPKNGSGEISRREFLKDAGLLVGGTAIGSTVLLAACGGEGATETVTKTVTSTVPGTTVTTTAGEVTKTVTTTAPGDGVQTITITKTVEVPGEAAENVVKLTINGQEYELQVEPNWTLVEVIRNKLGFTGTKIGCDQGTCGSCTVILDGRPILSCCILAIDCNGKEVMTIEGLMNGEGLHPIQEAYLDFVGYQCGFCTPGSIMSAKALLDSTLTPTEDEVREALAGNLCRCGQYPQQVTAILAAADKIRRE